jgi:glycosyltransferase involved in cell wall biosynthesis
LLYRGNCWPDNYFAPFYDVIIANHKPIIYYLFQYGYIIQTTHGQLPGIEEPSCFADYHVSVSERTQIYLSKLNIKSKIILNGIDCERFSPETPIHEKLTCVLSLCQSKEAHKFVSHCCKKIGVIKQLLNCRTDEIVKKQNIT